MQNYYVAKPGTQQPLGPYTVEQIREKLALGEIAPEFLYFTEGMQQWAPLSTLPGMPAPYPSIPRFTSAPVPTTKSPGELVWSILATLFCCLPFGVVAIIYSVKADDLHKQGRYAEARTAAATASTWRRWSFWSVIIYFIICIFAGFAAG